MPNNDTVTKIVTDAMVALQAALRDQIDDIFIAREVSARKSFQLRECVETLVSGAKDVLIHKLSPVAGVQGVHSPAQQDSGTVALPPAPKPILITYSPTAGLTPEQLATLEGKRLNWSTHLHIQDVQNTLKFLTDRLTEKADRHDFTKLIGSEAFLNYVHNNFQGDWWQHHLEAEPHHLHYTHQLTLLDILEHVADGCCAGMARTGTVRGFKIPNAVLERAVDNTVALLVSNMECAPHPPEISRAQVEKVVAAIEQGAPFDDPKPTGRVDGVQLDTPWPPPVITPEQLNVLHQDRIECQFYYQAMFPNVEPLGEEGNVYWMTFDMIKLTIGFGRKFTHTPAITIPIHELGLIEVTQEGHVKTFSLDYHPTEAIG